MAENNVVTTPDDAKEASTMNSKELAKLKGQLRAQAERAVVQRHQDEYHEEAHKLFAEHGLEFRYRLTPKQRKAKELEKLIAEHPDLAAHYGLNAAPTVKDEADTSGPF